MFIEEADLVNQFYSGERLAVSFMFFTNYV